MMNIFNKKINISNFLKFDKLNYVYGNIIKQFCTNNPVITSKPKYKSIYNKPSNSDSNTPQNFEKPTQSSSKTEGVNEDLFNKNLKEGMDEYFNKMSKFSSDFSKVKSNPKASSSGSTISSPSREETDIETKISIMLNSERIREKGSSYLIDTLLDLYKHIMQIDQKNKDMTYEAYSQKVNLKLDKRVKNKIREVFSRNEVVDAITLIMRHLNDLKSTDLAKFINVLIKIDYSNFENWKKILKQYIMYLSLITPDYKPLFNKDVVQILHHLKNMYNFLPYLSDDEIQTLLERAIKESIEFIIKNINTLELKHVATTITSMSKLGMLDEEVCRKIEKFLINVISEENAMSDADFANILFCIFKSKTASENLINMLEKYAEKIIDYYTKYPKEIDTHSLTMIVKSFYYGYRSETKKLNIFKKIEALFISYSNNFQIHDSVIIAHSLYYLDKPSEEFFRTYDTALHKFNNLNKMSELLNFQVLLVMLKRGEFSDENIVKYVKLYKNYVNVGQVKKKQIDVFINLLKLKIKKGGFSNETQDYLNETLKDITEYSKNSRKITDF